MAKTTNRQLGGYRLIEHLGTGGMATVFRASDESSSRIVAVKIFEPNEERSAEFARRLRDREVRMLVSVQHPNIVTFYDVGNDGERYFYAMEFVENSLLKRMRNGDEFSLVEKVHMIRQTVNALVAIHRQGIVHRDVKPGNILLDEDPGGALHVKLTDLGIAKSVSETDIAREQMPTTVPGTAKYLCPEQIRLEPVDGRADIFSLGIVSYELLSGKPPIEAKTSEDFLKANASLAPPPVHEVNPDVPEVLSDIVARMLTLDREDRYDSETLARDLQILQQHLISGAELVERNNPASMFYAEPEEESEEVSGIVSVTQRLSAWSILSAAGMLVCAFTAGFLLWPRSAAAPGPHSSGAEGNTPDGPPPDTAVAVRLPDETPSEILARARTASAEGRELQALALAERALESGLPEAEKSAAEDIRSRFAADRVAALQDTGMAMISGGRLGEAGVVLARLKEQATGTASAEPLQTVLRDAEAAREEEKAWRARLAAAHDLVEQGNYEEALLKYDEAADSVRENAERRLALVAQGRTALKAWGESVLRKEDPQAAAKWLERVSQERFDQLRPRDEILAPLHLLVANDYAARAVRNPELAPEVEEHYKAALNSTHAPSQAAARLKLTAFRQWLAERNVENMIKDIKGKGFGSDYWTATESPNTSTEVKDGVLQLRAARNSQGKEVCLATQGELRRDTFKVGMAMNTGPMGQSGLGRLGIELTDDKGALYQFYFDGDEYRININGIHGLLQNAVGDEQTKWHRMEVRYDPVAERVTALLDGKELRSNDLELTEARVKVFLRAIPGATAGVDMKDFVLDQ